MSEHGYVYVADSEVVADLTAAVLILKHKFKLHPKMVNVRWNRMVYYGLFKIIWGDQEPHGRKAFLRSL